MAAPTEIGGFKVGDPVWLGERPGVVYRLFAKGTIWVKVPPWHGGRASPATVWPQNLRKREENTARPLEKLTDRELQRLHDTEVAEGRGTAVRCAEARSEAWFRGIALEGAHAERRRGGE